MSKATWSLHTHTLSTEAWKSIVKPWQQPKASLDRHADDDCSESGTRVVVANMTAWERCPPPPWHDCGDGATPNARTLAQRHIFMRDLRPPDLAGAPRRMLTSPGSHTRRPRKPHRISATRTRAPACAQTLLATPSTHMRVRSTFRAQVVAKSDIVGIALSMGYICMKLHGYIMHNNLRPTSSCCLWGTSSPSHRSLRGRARSAVEVHQDCAQVPWAYVDDACAVDLGPLLP